MRLLVHWIISAISLLIVAWIFPKIWFDHVSTAFLAAIVLGLINTFIRPVLQFLALPITFLTVGIFALVINAAMLELSSHIVPGFHVEGFGNAFFGSIALWIISGILHAFLVDKKV
ncbi:phage holin family protein [Aneurinibacillus terranovensis]|uniref:phage holin family protein n=1 Tax=Aneurinibacillus terranovensis TaxID=278991 RepID=UPI000403FF8A|nr:phage holin family protein [Aneurinibacillus terranovensis]